MADLDGFFPGGAVGRQQPRLDESIRHRVQALRFRRVGQRQFAHSGAAAGGVLLGRARLDQPQEQRPRQRPVMLVRQVVIGGFRVLRQRALHATQRLVCRPRQPLSRAPLVQQIERELEQRQPANLIAGLEHQIGDQPIVEGQACLLGRALNRLLQVGDPHRQHWFAMLLDQPPQLRIAQHAVKEIRAQRQDYGHGAAGSATAVVSRLMNCSRSCGLTVWVNTSSN